MAGRIQWEAQVDSNVAKLLSETKDLRDQLDGIKKGKYDVKLNIDDKKLKNVISNLDKMLNSLGKGTNNFKEFENLSKQLNGIVSEVKELNKAFGGINSSGVSNLLSSIQSIDRSLLSLSKHITNVNKDFGNIGKNASNNVSQINEARKATEKLTDATKKLSNTQKNVNNKSNVSSPIKDTFQGDVKVSAESSVPAIQNEAKAMEQVVESAERAAKGKDKFSKANKNVKESANSSVEAISKEASEFNKVISKLNGYQDKLKNFEIKPAKGYRYPLYEDNFNKLKSQIEELQALSGKDIKLISEDDVKRAQKIQDEINETILKMKNMSAGEKGFDPLGADKALEKINSELQKNSAMSKEAKHQINALYNEIKSGNPSKPIKDLLHEMYRLIQAEREAGRAGKSFVDIFKDKVIYGAAGQLAGMIGIYDIINVGRQAVDIVIDLNTQITELAKVSEATSSQIYDDFNSYAEIAKDVGGTISDTISATADWSRNGYNILDSKELAEVAMIYKNVGDGIDIDTANESLISTLRGFKMEAEDAMHIIDVFNEVDTLASYYSNVIALCRNT